MARFLAVTMVAVAVMFLAVPALAADKTHDGTVVSVTEGTNDAPGKLVDTEDESKKDHTHLIAATVKITLNGKAAKLGDLKKGDRVRVTVGENDKVTMVVATRK